MKNLPLIVGIGGINSAGRSSGFHSYKRLIHNAISKNEMENTWMDLANRMQINHNGNINQEVIDKILSGTLIRKIDSFKTEEVSVNRKAKCNNINFKIKTSSLPENIPTNWTIKEHNSSETIVSVTNEIDMLIPIATKLGVSSGATIPHGFDPGALYNSKHHPLGIKLAIYGASDAINSLGFQWQDILNCINPDEISVYAGSAIGQIDQQSMGGLFTQPLIGNRVSTKMLPLSLPDMPADFINGYVINNIGNTGANIGACASFLYNLKHGVSDIQSGRAKAVIVGSADAPLAPEIVEGFKSMGALATDEKLKSIDNSTHIDHTKSCRPFGKNCGFVIGNASQFIVLMEPDLALKLGANIYGSVADVFISADANKKSISAPGIGNYITFAKAVSLTKSIIGENSLNETFVQAHGTGTPQNRVSESHIINQVAKIFHIQDWIVSSIKAQVGHSFGAAGGDQIIASLGAWKYNWIPGINTIDKIADDVYTSNTKFIIDHYSIDDRKMQAAIINSKGFGGNNATGVILSPQKTYEILKRKYDKSTLLKYQNVNEEIKDKATQKDNNTCNGKEEITYLFGNDVMDKDDLKITQEEIILSKFNNPIKLNIPDPYK